MSRIGKAPIPVPKGVQINVSDKNVVTVKGPKGTLVQTMDPAIKVKETEGELVVERPSDAKPHRAKHGLYRALDRQHGDGRDRGLQDRTGTGGRGLPRHVKGQRLQLALGFSHSWCSSCPPRVKVAPDRKKERTPSSAWKAPTSS
jgi:large subunit ribosomal protein L6